MAPSLETSWNQGPVHEGKELIRVLRVHSLLTFSQEKTLKDHLVQLFHLQLRKLRPGGKSDITSL